MPYEVIKYLKPETTKVSTILNDKEAKQIISIIGEPILKSTLESMPETKLYTNETKLDKLKRQQEEIKKAIEIEEDKSNETD